MKPFLHGKKVLTTPALRIPPGRAGEKSAPRLALTCSTPSHAQRSEGEAQVEVVKEGDRVVRLVITCVCGERVEVECLYPAGS
jgi:hypothetical protein